MIRSLIAACLSSSVAAAAGAEPLQDCKSLGGVVSRLMESLRPAADSAQLLAIAGPLLRNGEVLSYGKDDPVLAVDVKVIRAVPVLVSSSDLYLKSSWFLSTSYRFKSGEPLNVQWSVTAANGESFSVIRLVGSALFVDSQGRLCNSALNTSSSPNVWMAGTLSQEGQPVVLDRKVTEQDGPAGSLRVIFNGVNAGALNFQEVWVNGATVVRSVARSFDQFAKSVKIGPVTMQVLGINEGRVSLRYEVPDRSTVEPHELRSIEPMLRRQ